MKTLERPDLATILSAAAAADVTPLREFFSQNPSQPLIATGSGGAESSAEFAALLYGACGGVGCATSPYTLNSSSDATLKSSKLLLISSGGHNNDIVFAAKRGLAANPKDTAMLCLYNGERNKVQQLFNEAGARHSFCYPIHSAPDGFVSTNTPFKYFALLARAFDPKCDPLKYIDIPLQSFRTEYNDGSPLSLEALGAVKNFTILHGSWGRPVACNLESKLVESGYAMASVCDYRNYCHGRFIYTSNHLADSAVVLFISPREREIADRIRGFLPGKTMLIVIETEHDAPEASLDLLVRSTEFFLEFCETAGVNPDTPKNPGKIDKRVPMWIPFIAGLKKSGPLAIR